MGVALLYAYRAQEEPTEEIDRSARVQLIQRGQVEKVTISGTTAILTLRGSEEKKQTTLAQEDPNFIKTIDDSTALTPDRQIDQGFQEESATLGLIGSVLLSLLPVLLIGGFFIYMMRQAQGTNNQVPVFGQRRAREFIGDKRIVTL